MLGNYLQQTTSADVIFQMHFYWPFKGGPESKNFKIREY